MNSSTEIEPTVPPETTTTPEPAPEVEYEGLAIWPLIYILVLPAAVIGILQWSGLPAWLMHVVTGH